MLKLYSHPTKENGLEGLYKAIVESKDGEEYIDIGDAKKKNVNKQIADHVLRMAATRAKARALRDYTNIGLNQRPPVECGPGPFERPSSYLHT